jgi:hypothetical protein
MCDQIISEMILVFNAAERIDDGNEFGSGEGTVLGHDITFLSGLAFPIP